MIKDTKAETLSGNHPASIAKGSMITNIRVKCTDVLNNNDFLELENMSAPKLNVIPINAQMVTAINIVCNSLKY